MKQNFSKSKILLGSSKLEHFHWGAGFSLVGGLGGPHELYVPPHNSCVPPIFVDHDKNFFRYFFNLCMTKANNLTSITSLIMQLYCFIEILKQQQLKSLK